MIQRLLLKVWNTVDDRLGLVKNLKPIMDHRVPEESKWAYVFGSATLFAFILQVVTGVALATVYDPSATGAYHSLEYISRQATLGSFVRGLHYFGASAMVLFIGIHMLRVFLYAAYKFPREGNWLTGVVLLMFTLGMGFTGQLMRWDQDAVWSVNIAARQAVRVPFVGKYLQQFVYAGDRLSGLTLNHFFDLHVFIIPGIMFAFIGVHLYLVLYNGISEPPKVGVPVDPKTYRRQYKELVTKNGVPFWPDAAWRDALFGSLVIAGVVTLAFIYGAPHLAPPPNPTLLNAEPRPDWYLLWYFAILAMSPHQLESGIMILAPAMVFGSMFALPFFFNSGERSLRRRPWAVAWVTIVVVGVCTLWYEGKVSPWSPRFDAPPLPASLTASLSASAQRGATLFHDKRCESCHMIESYGGLRGPNLSRAADRLTREQMEWRILNGGHNMPSFAGILKPEEVDDLLSFLHTRDLPSGTQLGSMQPDVYSGDAMARIEDYAMIGDCETAALVSRDGNIDWLCWPDFSSPACFAALLGSAKNGRWQLAPHDEHTVFSRRYRPRTLILETKMETPGGSVLITDFMPIRGRHSDLVRVVQCTAGTVKMHMELCVRFDYGSTIPWIHFEPVTRGGSVWVAKAGPNLTVLRAASLVKESEPGTLSADFTVNMGETQTFALTYGCSYDELPDPVDIDRALHETDHFWTEWVSHNKYQGPYGAAVERSLITLKAMTFRPSGGMVAAPTTSLPERIGGPLNWDYRYCWIRDATFTLSALIECGYTEEVIAWKQWLVRAIGRGTPQVQIMYGIGGERHIADWEVPWLPGYENSSPVRIGNAAQHQNQQDIFGEIAAALAHARKAGVPCQQEEEELQQDLTEYLVKTWRQPGSGMWESRDKPQRYTYSSVMAWVALKRAVESVERHEMEGPLEEWKELRDKIHADICRHGFDTHLDSFVRYYGSKALDASELMLLVYDFLPANDPRVLSTLKAIEQGLLKDGFLLRNLPKSKRAKQGAFLACSFWLVENYALTGRIEEARKLFEKVLAVSNDVGLLSEEYDTRRKRLIGNFPQAFSHIALVRAAMRLAEHPQ